VSEVRLNLERITDAYVAFCERRSGLVLLMAFFLAALSLTGARRLDVDPEIQALLPADTPSAKAVDELRSRTANDTPLYFLIQSSDARLNRRLARQIVERVKSWDETLWVMNRRDPGYFLDNRLLYVPAERIEELADKIEWIVDWEECEAVPLCVNIDDRPENPTEDEIEKLFLDVPEAQALKGMLGAKELPKPTKKDSNEASPDDAPGAEDGKALLGELCNGDGSVCAVEAILDGNPANVEYATRIGKRSEALFEELRPADAPADLKMVISGQYRDVPLTREAVASDLSKTASLSVTLVLLVLLFQFRSIRSFVLLLAPLLIATAWTLGAIAMLHPHLNLISAFTLVVLAGLGVDFGVHMLTYYATLREGGHQPGEALRHTLRSLGASMAAAAVTTSCGFAALAAAEFRGFAEMGPLAALGIGLALVAYLLLFPAFVLLADRIVPERKPLVWRWPFFKPTTPRRSIMVAVAGLGVVVGVMSAWYGARGIDFEYDTSKLSPPVIGHGIPHGEAVHGTTRTAIYLVADDPIALEKAAEALRTRDAVDLADPSKPWLITPRSFVPLDQEQRLAAIAHLEKAVQAAKKRGDDELRDKLKPLEPLLHVTEPITQEALPRWMRESFLERDGTFGKFGILYTDYRGADARQMEELARRIEQWHEKHPDVRFASGLALLGEIVPTLRRDAPYIIGLAFFGLFFSILIVSRSWRRTLLVTAPLLLSGALTLAAMVAFDLKVNFYNMLIFPLAFGIGVDGAIYITWEAVRGNEEAFRTEASRAVLVSTLTTAVAFGSMIIASNPGLQSLGETAVAAFGASLIANLVWLPAFIRATRRSRPPRVGPSTP
jgi:hypothetical protein